MSAVPNPVRPAPIVRRRRPRIALGFVLSLLALVSSLALGLAAAPTATAASWWVPPLGSQPWQWELTNPLNFNSASGDGHR